VLISYMYYLLQCNTRRSIATHRYYFNQWQHLFDWSHYSKIK